MIFDTLSFDHDEPLETMVNRDRELGPGSTVHGLFYAAVVDDGDRCFLQRRGADFLTYRDALRAVAATMARLTALGIRRGDLVVSYLEDTIGLALFDLACSSLGVVPVPLSHHFSLKRLRDLVESVSAKAILTAPELVDRLPALGIPVLFFGEPGATRDSLEVRPNLSVDDAQRIVATLQVPVTDRDPFMVQPTSGSTGAPKLVVRSHASFTRYANFVGEQVRSELDRPPVFLSVQALTHAFGLHLFTTALSMSAAVVVPAELDTNASLTDVWALKPTVLPMVPRVLRSFYRQHTQELADEPARRMFPPSARLVLIAGGKGDPEILQLCAGQGVEPIEFYGSSEASLVALTPRGQWRPDWAGRVVSDASVRLEPDGEVLVRSPGLMSGYHGAGDLTRKAFTEDGFYRTGDLGALSVDGYLRILGRKVDAFNTPEGSYVYPERIESRIERLPWVRQAILVGDERPYITAYIAMDDSGSGGATTDGFLDDVEHRTLYVRVQADLAAVNEELERHEKIIVFSLFARPFEPAVYASVGQGKVNRDRRGFELLYQARIARAYDSSFDFVNSAQRLAEERRYRPRQAVHGSGSQAFLEAEAEAKLVQVAEDGCAVEATSEVRAQLATPLAATPGSVE